MQISKEVLACISKTRLRMRSMDTQEFITPILSIPATYLLGGKSKLFRSALVFITAEAVGLPPRDMIDLALAIELLHTSSLIHDDILDHDGRRRGKQSVHKRYGIETAIIAGDALISKAIHLSAKYGEKVNKEVAMAAMSMCAGELLDYKHQNAVSVPKLSEYLRITELKSSSLIASSCSSVALYSGSTLANRIKKFGLDLGTAFQIKDDIEDYGSGPNIQRSNIVKVLASAYRTRKDEAVSKALYLNSVYLDKAKSRLSGNKKLAALSYYSEMARA